MMITAAKKDPKMIVMDKLPPVIEDLRNHTPEQMAELRFLINANVIGRPDMRRPGFYEIDGEANVYYIFRYPTGHKVLLLAAWEKQSDPAAEMAACSCPAA